MAFAGCLAAFVLSPRAFTGVISRYPVLFVEGLLALTGYTVLVALVAFVRGSVVFSVGKMTPSIGSVVFA